MWPHRNIFASNVECKTDACFSELDSLHHMKSIQMLQGRRNVYVPLQGNGVEELNKRKKKSFIIFNSMTLHSMYCHMLNNFEKKWNFLYFPYKHFGVNLICVINLVIKVRLFLYKFN